MAQQIESDITVAVPGSGTGLVGIYTVPAGKNLFIRWLNIMGSAVPSGSFIGFASSGGEIASLLGVYGNASNGLATYTFNPNKRLIIKGGSTISYIFQSSGSGYSGHFELLGLLE